MIYYICTIYQCIIRLLWTNATSPLELRCCFGFALGSGHGVLGRAGILGSGRTCRIEQFLFIRALLDVCMSSSKKTSKKDFKKVPNGKKSVQTSTNSRVAPL